SNEIVIGVLRVDVNAVVIDVLPALAEVAQVLAAIVGNLDQDTHHVDAVLLLGIDDQVRVVLRLLVEAVAFLPGLAVGRAENAAVAVDGLDDGIDDVRVGGRDGESDAAEVGARQTAADFLPVRPAVGGLVNGTFGTAIDERPHMAAPLVGGGEEDIGIARVEDDI